MGQELDGRDVYLIINDLKFANERGLTNSETQDTLETTNKHTPNYRKTYIAGEGTGTLTANGFYCVTAGSGEAGYHELKALKKARTVITYEVGKFAAGGIIEAGNGIISNVNATFNGNEPAQFDITIQKTGDYTEGSHTS